MRDLETSSASAAHMLLVNIERAFLKKSVCTSILSRVFGFTTIDATIVLLLLLLHRVLEKKSEQQETVVINKDGREARQEASTRVIHFRRLSVICTCCMQIKDYVGQDHRVI